MENTFEIVRRCRCLKWSSSIGQWVGPLKATTHHARKKFGAKSLSDDRKDKSVELATVNLQKQVLLTKTTFL